MEEIRELLDKAMFNIAIRLQNELLITCPVDTGRLKNSIKVLPQDQGLIIGMVGYGKFVEFGTPPHVIIPTEKKALKFKAGGEEIIVKKVQHPGTRPNPFVRTALFTKLGKIIEEEIIRAKKV